MPPGIRPLRWPQTLLALVAATALTALPQSATSAAAVVIRQQEWPLDAQHFDAASIWPLTRGQGATVAVVDSGVDASHPDLAGQVLRGTGFIGDPNDTGQSDISTDSHGTAIAGIIAGTGTAQNGSGMIGLAPQAKILPVRVGAQGAVTPLSLAQGIKYAADHHAQVINVSLATPTPDPVLREAVDYALGKDAVLVAAAGNSGQDGNPLMYPAAFPGVIDVTGTDSQGRFWPVSESSPRSTLAAPSTNIYSANNQGQYVQAEGTSYGAAYVSAAAALVRAAHPGLTAAQTIQRLITSAQHPHGPGTHDNQYGYGVVSPLAALQSTADTPDGTNPLLAAPTSGPNTDSRSRTVAIGIAGGLTVVTVGAVVMLRLRRRTTRPHSIAPPPPAKRPKTPANGKRSR
ncbi:type VII secretion-associated serine protease mycosin [Streptomyces sp. NPDC052811]|uniref:type VII secretion-associated serine protease mycosin n=1 Tax=Streptomyces sp. NPDC052811 TaxID=3155731 RepID=UPI0034142CAE